MEVYVDDILVKSSKEEDHPNDLIETFQNLLEVGKRFKPNKFFLGMKNGKFLGYQISKDGISANPEKVEAIFRDLAS